MSENLSQNNTIDIENLSKIKNVKVRLQAELGRAKISLKEAIEFDKDSVVTLDKLEDEPVDIYVDEILIAKAKIVAIEDTYGIKIVEIVESKNKQTN